MVATKVYSSEQWKAHLDTLGQTIGLRSRADVIQEAVRLLAQATGVPPLDRYPGTRVEAGTIQPSRLLPK